MEVVKKAFDLKKEIQRKLFLLGLGVLAFKILFGIFVVFMLFASVASMTSTIDGVTRITVGWVSGAPTTVAKQNVPNDFLTIAVGAENKYKVSWAILAAMAKKETDYGKDNNDIVFNIPIELWQKYHVDGNGDGEVEIDNNHDVIFTVARILAENDFSKDPQNAIKAYKNQTSFVKEVVALALSLSPDITVSSDLMWPVPGYTNITSPFSLNRLHPVLKVHRPHRGIDIDAPKGAEVVAAEAGVVTFVGKGGGYGNVVKINHNGFETLYAHLSNFGKNLKTGMEVEKGFKIGYVGSTGLSTGPHLHFEVRVGGVGQNPINWFTGSGNF